VLAGSAIASSANTTKPMIPETTTARNIAFGAALRGLIVSSARSAAPSQPSST
jgi:hypothetical protein